MRTSWSRTSTLGWLAGLLAVALAVAGCGASSTGSSKGDAGSMSGMPHSAASANGRQMPGMNGMDMSAGTGLSASAHGFTFMPADASMPPGEAVDFTFHIMRAGGKAVTTFVPDQTKLMHFYLIRSDLTGFQHVHPTMTPGGVWTAPLQAAAPGRYRAYASFMTKGMGDTPMVLSRSVTVPGKARKQPLPPATGTATVDGYTLTLSGKAMSGMEHPLTVTVSRNGKPVTNLQPYLDTDAHLTAFHRGDLAFAHLHPEGAPTGGPRLTFDAMLPKPGPYRLFMQFQAGGRLHTAVFTLRAS